MRHRLVIGYGNTLRGDDGLGPRVVAPLRVPGVRTLILPQLGPELAAELALVQRVIFVDARLGRGGPHLRRLPLADPQPQSHHCDPAGLLALSAALYGHAPQAWLLSIPAARFDLGAPLSPAARHNRLLALRRLRRLLERFPAGRASHISAA
ncbi:MAG: hydrogenase maturation protease [Oscillochloris sp.]|nr:hydrogenase maturation protease [Oscillochloris sp.]